MSKQLNRYASWKKKKIAHVNNIFLNVTTNKLLGWFYHHVSCAKNIFTTLAKAPITYVTTILVMACALALPTIFLLAINNLTNIADNWQRDGTKFTIFLKDDLSEDDAISVNKKLQTYSSVISTQLITKDEAAISFADKLGIQDVITDLPTNPLPYTVIVEPKLSSSQELLSLVQKISKLSDVDSIQFDYEWIKKLQMLIQLGKKIAILLIGFVTIAVALIIGNTINLLIQNKKEEIQIVKLIGANDSFVIRPFLYIGLGVSLFSSILTILMVNFCFIFLQENITTLVMLYQSSFKLEGLKIEGILTLIFSSCLLAFCCSWLVVKKYLLNLR